MARTEGGGVHDGQQADDPRVLGPGRPQVEQRRIGRVAFGDVGRPPLPLGEQAGQVVDAADQLVADEELGPPGRRAGPALEQGDQCLAAVVGGVQGGQVGDLEGDQDQAGPGGHEVDHP